MTFDGRGSSDDDWIDELRRRGRTRDPSDAERFRDYDSQSDPYGGYGDRYGGYGAGQQGDPGTYGGAHGGGYAGPYGTGGGYGTGDEYGAAYDGRAEDPDSVAAARQALGSDGPGGPGGPDDGGPGRPSRRGRRKRRRRRILAVIAAGFAFLLVALTGMLYGLAKVPAPKEIATKQISTITFSDGQAVMARIGPENRTDVPLARVPERVRWAVLSAEHRTFYSDPGISARGIVRAAWNNLRGNELQGGSGITQQYAKNAYLTQEKTLTRKFKELAIAIKLDREYSKDQILEWYLNTIYFGRGAYGIQAAAQTYFGRNVGQLSSEQAAVLAASIRSPALYDPQTHLKAAQERWRFVLTGMVEMGKLSQEQAAAMKYPKVRPRSTGNGQTQLAGWAGLVVQQVKDELARNGFDEATLNAKGLRVVTTIDRNAQSAAITAVREVFKGQPRKLRQALVAVDPSSGRVVAYYGGAKGDGFDYAQAWRQPGSSFKPYVLAAALQQSLQPEGEPISLYSTFDGSSPREFNGVPVRNSGNAQCNPCSVLEAMERSVNTVFYDLAIQTGPDNVAEIAHKLGVPGKRTDNGRPTLQVDGITDGSIGIGRYEVRPIDQAVGFSTFANGGRLYQPYFVQKVLDASGNVLYEHQDDPKRVLDPKVANDVTYALKPVPAHADDELADDREAAAKTGTQQYAKTEDNTDAWMVGFTPQVTAAVWVGTDKPGPIRNAEDAPIYGAGLPGKTWQAFMNSYLSGRPKVELTDKVEVNPEQRPRPTATEAPRTSAPPSRTSTPRPTSPRPSSPKPTPTKTASPTPTATPTLPLPTPTITATPSRTRPGLPP